MLAHVRVHVRDVDVQVAIVLEIERLDAHRSPRSIREQVAARSFEFSALSVEENLIVALHVEEIEICPTVVVDVHWRSISRPSSVFEPDRGAHVFKLSLTEVPIEPAGLQPLGF